MNVLICVFWITAGFVGGVLVASQELRGLKSRLRTMVESEKHWNEECGWDVPSIAVLDVIEGRKPSDIQEADRA